jgi:Family of unknown function (DUF6152)
MKSVSSSSARRVPDDSPHPVVGRLRGSAARECSVSSSQHDGVFDFNDRVTLTGTLSKVDWRNPHTYLTVDVKNATGAMETWQSEGPSPSWFRIRDIGKADFEQTMGKTLTLELSRARDKSLWV